MPSKLNAIVWTVACLCLSCTAAKAPKPPEPVSAMPKKLRIAFDRGSNYPAGFTERLTEWIALAVHPLGVEEVELAPESSGTSTALYKGILAKKFDFAEFRPYRYIDEQFDGYAALLTLGRRERGGLPVEQLTYRSVLLALNNSPIDRVNQLFRSVIAIPGSERSTSGFVYPWLALLAKGIHLVPNDTARKLPAQRIFYEPIGRLKDGTTFSSPHDAIGPALHAGDFPAGTTYERVRYPETNIANPDEANAIAQNPLTDCRTLLTSPPIPSTIIAVKTSLLRDHPELVRKVREVFLSREARATNEKRSTEQWLYFAHANDADFDDIRAVYNLRERYTHALEGTQPLEPFETEANALVQRIENAYLEYAGRYRPVVDVRDAQTVVVSIAGNRVPVRLLGIDSPNRWREHEVPYYAGQSIKWLRSKLLGQLVELTLFSPDPSDPWVPRAYVWLDKQHEQLVNEQMLHAGWARASDQAHERQRDFLHAQQAAQLGVDAKGMYSKAYAEAVRTPRFYFATRSSLSRSGRFHREGCMAIEWTRPENIVVFPLRQGAMDEGLRPCSYCDP